VEYTVEAVGHTAEAAKRIDDEVAEGTVEEAEDTVGEVEDSNPLEGVEERSNNCVHGDLPRSWYGCYGR